MLHRAVVAHVFNPSIWETEAGRFLSSRPAWSTEWVPGQSGLHRETLSQKTKTKTKQNKTSQMLYICLMLSEDTMGCCMWLIPTFLHRTTWVAGVLGSEEPGCPGWEERGGAQLSLATAFQKQAQPRGASSVGRVQPGRESQRAAEMAPLFLQRTQVQFPTSLQHLTTA